MRKLVLWGHDVDDYCKMFDLSVRDLQGSILEFGCGPSAVNQTLTTQGHRVVSADPLFTLDKDILSAKAHMIFDEMYDHVIEANTYFDFSSVGGFDAFVTRRRVGMSRFFADFDAGIEEERYLALTELALPFDDFTFDCAVSSHYLFADLDDQDVPFHLTAIKELARVAKEVRIFPLIDRNGHPSPFLGPVLLGLQQDNFGVEVRQVDYPLEPAGNAMLRVWAHECKVK